VSGAEAGPVYLDHAATAPLDPHVAAVMRACIEDPRLQANPASAHAPGRESARRIALARADVASLVGAPADAIVLTSGATESVNLAVLGAARAAGAARRHVVTSRVEHRAGVDACRQLEREGFEVTWLAPDADGRIEPGQVGAAIRDDTALVSLMHVNNETGAVTDVGSIAALCAARGVTFHADAAQSAGRIPVDVQATGVALLSFCAHKLGGPRGIGALYVRRRPRPALQPLVFGGGHERGLRSGTLALHQVAGFGAACELARRDLEAEAGRLSALRERLWQRLAAAAPLWRNGSDRATAPGILNVGFAGIEGESLLLAVDGELAVSSGAACSSATGEPSYVLRALGRTDEAIQASIRLSLGRGTTAADVDRAADVLLRAVARLRGALPPGAVERIA
jgi:cysteine desulfurase